METLLKTCFRFYYRSTFVNKLKKETAVATKTDLRNLEKYLHDLYDGIELVNSTFTFHLIPVMINIIIFKTFLSYGILWELLLRSEIMTFVLIQNGAWLGTHIILEVLIAYVGTLLTRNAKKPSIIITNILTNHDLSENLSSELQNVIIRINSRNTVLQNEFFKINWQLLVYVSCVQSFLSSKKRTLAQFYFQIVKHTNQ